MFELFIDFLFCIVYTMILKHIFNYVIFVSEVVDSRGSQLPFQFPNVIYVLNIIMYTIQIEN